MGKVFKGVGNAIGSVVGGITGASQAASGARQAANIQSRAAQQGIDQIQALLSPFINAGTGALGAYGDLLGTNGAAKYNAALAGIRGGPEYAALMQQGTNSLLQNASATGGLRGGNLQGALAQFAPALLTQLVNQKLAGYGGLISNGQNAASNAGRSIADLLAQKGAAQAGGVLAQSQVPGQAFGSALQLGGLALGLGGLGGLGGGGLLSGQAGGGLGGLTGTIGGGTSSFLQGGGLGSGGIGGSLFN